MPAMLREKNSTKKNVGCVSYLVGFCWQISHRTNSQCLDIVCVCVLVSNKVYVYHWDSQKLRLDWTWWLSLSPCYPCCMCICVSKVTTCDSHNTGLRGDTRELFQVVGICIHTSVSSIDFNRLSNNFKWLHRYIDFGILEYLNEPFLHIRFSRLLL